MSNVVPIRTCAYCGGPAEGNYSIHVTEAGFLGDDTVPQVPLCDAHGSEPWPTCEQIWDRIADAAGKETRR